MLDVPDAKDAYRFLSRFTADPFVNMVLRILNAICGKRKRGKTVIIGDTTSLTVNLNWFRKKYKKEDLEDKDYKWAYSKSKGVKDTNNWTNSLIKPQINTDKGK